MGDKKHHKLFDALCCCNCQQGGGLGTRWQLYRWGDPPLVTPDPGVTSSHNRDGQCSHTWLQWIVKNSFKAKKSIEFSWKMQNELEFLLFWSLCFIFWPSTINSYCPSLISRCEGVKDNKSWWSWDINDSSDISISFVWPVSLKLDIDRELKSVVCLHRVEWNHVKVVNTTHSVTIQFWLDDYWMIDGVYQ